VTLHANSIAGTLYNNKFENLETSMKTGTVSVNCSLQWSNNGRKTEKSPNLGEISAVTVRLGQTHFQSL